jgi:hypothetical protein
MGLATAVNRLKDKAKSKIVILPTDGVNNAGLLLEPETAADMPNSMVGIKRHTHRFGSNEKG